MKKELKIKRKVGLAIFGLLTVFASCEKEDTHHPKHEKTNIVRNVKLSDLTSLQNVLKKNSAQRRDTINYFDLIDENSITVITRNNGDRTYTFSLQVAEINKLTNLVVRESGNEHSFDLVEYSSNDLERWKTDIENNYIPSVEVTVTVTPLNSNVAICLAGSYVCPSGLHSTGEEVECVFGFGEWSYTLMQVPCFLDDGDEGGGDSGSGNGNTPPAPPASEDPDPYTEPVFPVLTSAILDFIATLYPDWGNLDVETQTQIVNYLIQNTKNNIINPQAQEFAEWAVDALNAGGQVDFNLEVIIDPSFENNTTLMNVYNQFGGLPTFQSYLQNFEGTFSVAHLILAASSALPSTTNAQTSAPQNYVITITFNANNLDRPDLSIARTMMHEMIHAEIYRKLLSVWQQPSLNGLTLDDLNLMKDDFPGLVDYYTRWYNNTPPGMNLSTAQHQLMAQHYRDIIIQALIEFDDSHPNELYQALAWEGLMDTIAWNNLSEQERIDILQLIQDFEN